MLEQTEKIEYRFDELEAMLIDPAIVSDYQKVRDVLQELSQIREIVELSRSLRSTMWKIDELNVLLPHEPEDVAELIREELKELLDLAEATKQSLQVALIPKDPNDKKNVVMEIRAGTGGDEAGLFAADLYRMYHRYSQRQNWKTEIINLNANGTTMIKEVVFTVSGDGAYSRLKNESGVHRVQRIPTTESKGRIHTSAVTVAVLPEAEEIDIEINKNDIDTDVFHASGKGGQGVNKVATAIRLTHIPTGIVATCQDERSQGANKERAMSVLRSRVLAQEVEAANKKRADARRGQVGSGDRSERVRTYNFPQSRITDHRIGMTVHNLTQVMDGDIDELIEGLITDEQTRLLSKPLADNRTDTY